jgi:hypothetical protein
MPVRHSDRSEQRERSGGISDSFTRQREAGTGFRAREPFLYQEGHLWDVMLGR